jgi:very-short-patch-repair endonuclease
MLKDAAPKAKPRTTSHARKLRRQMPLPEVILWHWLRRRPGGLKFRRQHPTGPYVLDFYCGDARLAIEIDGEAHSRGDAPAKDAVRDAWLARAGIETVRIPAREVLANLDGVLTHIAEHAIARLPLHHPAAPAGPPPRGKLEED